MASQTALPELPEEEEHIPSSSPSPSPSRSRSPSPIDQSFYFSEMAEEEEEEGEPARTGVSHTAAGAPPKPPIRHPSVYQVNQMKYSPLPWDEFFDEAKDISILDSEKVFHLYTAGKDGPVVFCLHGGGYSGLSFAIAAKQMKEKVRVVAMDMRGHGLSHTEDDANLSAETLCADVSEVISTVYGKESPSIILVGHSMGGAIAIRLAAKRILPNLAGLVIVDVVEGTAMASLVYMQQFLSNRQSHFPTIEKAIEWSVKAGSLRNTQSARVSIPSTLTFHEGKKWYCE